MIDLLPLTLHTLARFSWYCCRCGVNVLELPFNKISATTNTVFLFLLHALSTVPFQSTIVNVIRKDGDRGMRRKA